MAAGPPRAGSRSHSMWLAAACLCASAVVHATDRQDPAALQAHAERFLKTQSSGLPGTVSIEVKPPRSALPACSVLDAFQPAGSRGIGKISVGVRCLAPTPWTVYLPPICSNVVIFCTASRWDWSWAAPPALWWVCSCCCSNPAASKLAVVPRSRWHWLAPVSAPGRRA